MGLFGKKKLKLLIAEDDTNIRNIIKFTLESANYQVVEFDNGGDALKAIPKEMPDAILLDVMMPIKNGFEVCYEVKQNTKLNHIPVLILTATTQTSSKSDEYWKAKSKADVFITKPFKAAVLLKEVSEMIARAKDGGDTQYRI
jgi:DNA-binding response OmpR family regulator